MMKFINEFSEKESENISQEFKRVNDKFYLDHAGTTLYSEKQIEFVAKMLKENLFCNPHTCKITADLVDQVRFKIVKHFNADPNEYKIVFTSGTSGGLKTVAECFDFGKTGSFFYCQENHTSVLGMREVVNTNNIFVLTNDEILENINSENVKYLKNLTGNSLVTFSAQCNLSGYKMPLEIISAIKTNQLKNQGKCIRGNHNDNYNDFYICLDAASFVATNFLDLEKFKPDFVCISFYKIFGYPTGLGGLIVNKRGQKILKKKFFGGGTVNISMAREDFHEKRRDFTAQFEDGTISFLSISALLEGFRTHERLITPKIEKNSMQRISNHVYNLAKYCYDSLKSLKHKNNYPLIKFYNHTNFEHCERQGGIICFNVLNDDGSFVGFSEIACIAAIHNVILRCGCFCNPGGCQSLLQLDDNELKKHFQAGHVCSDYNDLIDGTPTGAVRLSFGYMTTKLDADAAINMIKSCYLNESEKERIEKICKFNLPTVLQKVQQKFIVKSQPTKTIQLKSICVYPIKSCGRYKITGKWEINENGLKYDRTWMIVDLNGMAVTQKTNARLCLISPIINLDDNTLQLNFPLMESIILPLEFQNENKKEFFGTICQSKVCEDFVRGLDCGDKVANWLSNVLQYRGLRLFKQITDLDRKSFDGSPKEINLSNQAQFLLINTKSVEWLSSKVKNWDDNLNGDDLDGVIQRFRGNLIINTSNPLDENNFKSLRIGNVEFNLEGPCSRCQMICIDQKTGFKTAEPLKTISKQFKGKIKFGIYLSQTKKEKDFLSCSDEIFVEYNN